MADPKKWRGPILDPVMIGPDGKRRSRSGIVFSDESYAEAVKSLPPVGVVSAVLPREPLQNMNLPGVGGPATTAQVAAINAAAAQRAAAAAPVKPAKPRKPSGDGTGLDTGDTGGLGPDGGFSPPDFSGQLDSLMSSLSSPAALAQQARAMYGPDIASARQAYNRAIAEQRAENRLQSDILSRYGQAVNAYLADAATRAGRDFEAQAAAQAILGELGAGAFRNRPAGGTPIPGSGSEALLSDIERQRIAQGADIGQTLNVLFGTEPGSRALSQARGAQQVALSSAAGQAASGRRLLSSLLSSQSKALSDLIGERQEFEAKVPGVISKAVQDLRDAELKNILTASTLGFKAESAALARAREARLSAKDAAAAANKGRLSATKLADLNKGAADEARRLFYGGETTKENGEVVFLPGQERVTNYQQAFKRLQVKYGKYLTRSELLNKLNAVPEWSTPGVNGRPFLSVLEREYIQETYDLTPQQKKWLNDSPFNQEAAVNILRAIGR